MRVAKFLPASQVQWWTCAAPGLPQVSYSPRTVASGGQALGQHRPSSVVIPSMAPGTKKALGMYLLNSDGWMETRKMPISATDCQQRTSYHVAVDCDMALPVTTLN